MSHHLMTPPDSLFLVPSLDLDDPGYSVFDAQIGDDNIEYHRKPTGPTPAYVRELEAELLAMKAEMTTLALKADELVMELTGVDSPEDNPLVDTLPASISMVVHELMELAHLTLAAAKEAQS